MTDRIAANRWTRDKFLDKAREIRHRLLRWHESLPFSVGVNIQYEGQEVRVVPWHEYLETSRETFHSRLNAGHGQEISVFGYPYDMTGPPGPFEIAGQYKPDQTEYVLRDFREHLAGDDPELELLRVAFGRVLEVQVFSVHPLGIPVGQTIAIGDVVPGKTPWIVSSLKIDPQILDDFVEAAERLVAGQKTPPSVHLDKDDDCKPGENAADEKQVTGNAGSTSAAVNLDEGEGNGKAETNNGVVGDAASATLRSKKPQPRADQNEDHGNTQAIFSLLKVFTNGLADERLSKAAIFLQDDTLTTDDKLTEIDALMRFPATASAQQLGALLGVSKQAVMKTAWWIQHRKGERENEIGRREANHRDRAKRYEGNRTDDSDE